MKCLGLHDGHTSSVTFFNQGKLEFASQEERYTYVKNQGGLPLNAIGKIRKDFSIDDDTVIVLAGSHVPVLDYSKKAVLTDYSKSLGLSNYLKHKIKKSDLVYNLYQKSEYKKRIAVIRKEFPANEIVHVDHHTCHAASAYYGYGDYSQKVLVITADGDGDGKSASVHIGENGFLTEQFSIEAKDSLGRIYSFMTFLFNMVPYEHEYKIMGLAPYCKDQDRINDCKAQFYKLINFIDKDSLTWKYLGKYPSIQSAGYELKKIFYSYRFDILSAALQEYFEEVLVEWVTRLVKYYKINNVALSGGIFMNVKTNMLIAKIPDIVKVFVMPSCGDESNTIGAVYKYYFEKTGNIPEPLKNYYLGDEFEAAEDQIASYASDVFTYKMYDDIESKIAELLNNGNVVARVKGKMEFGARALGNRSILANPSVPNVTREINDAIKNRDFWMPFAPSVIEEDLSVYFDIDNSVQDYQYMIFTAHSKPEKRNYMMAALHPYDFTGRPQSVSELQNPDYYRLLKKYKELSGESLILNTSFNLHGYPIVRTLDQAMHVFLNSRLNYLALNNFLLTKITD